MYDCSCTLPYENIHFESAYINTILKYTNLNIVNLNCNLFTHHAHGIN